MDDLIKQVSENPDVVDTLNRADVTSLRDALAAQVKEIAAGIDTSTDVDADIAALEEAKDRHDRALLRLTALDMADSERAEKVAKLTEGIITTEAAEMCTWSAMVRCPRMPARPPIVQYAPIVALPATAAHPARAVCLPIRTL